ncbi:uncharacterized protein LOC116774843 [Danaus plexippus]|uniref:uncharacterized protein LOC116774843 n=1 Tax=Danaus plexippus TaxID=13037 RepID=UPI0013C453A0|nr:uncharacterized protein LOC116774843 [Danaus plexippus]
MCDIFPEVYSCFFIISMRIGMLLISVIAIMTGVLTLSVILKNTELSYEKVQILTHIKNPSDALQRLNTLVTSGISMMSCIFMFTGLVLLFGTLMDNDGFIQMFVWITFLNVVFGLILVIAVGYECTMMGSCVLAGMDWLSGSTLLVCIVGYLCLWIYFISIANSYVMSVNV